ncbi:NAD-dependent protein deacylase [Alkalilimnicola ehrlichii]|uniref:NAD-dependent protein deacylase n=1 Tax=Alkalilimnicola ehrlichii TaxID=351052 RepID=A0A3E0WUL5_9GAMM|nr:NAD-dependent deacylase [Alkalilimnicola ehrlichii]RFA28511.1 NAD-dependent protein deacylase [Alkalilimnicola ehrlichii]RFA35675.1 NAD-dependent protein deacylase [Alkalilimnicola ehrlichii]
MVTPELIDALKNSRRVAAITGAGISAESGIPTFRDAQTGLWAKYDPMQLATPEAFLENPERVWNWYAWRRELLAACRPNKGHQALSRIARHIPEFQLITQNVDGLHQAAGSQDVIELHGNIQRTKCFDHGHTVEQWDAQQAPPPCPYCGSLLRPDVVWFGEMLPVQALQQAEQAAARCEVFLSIGTSGQVYPAADLAYQALASGAMVVEINAEPTPLTARAHYAFTGKAGDQLPRLLAEIWQESVPDA